VSILLLVLLILTSVRITTRVSFSPAREKSCYANMRVVLGAVEMYNMDNSIFLEEVGTGTVEWLRSLSYLKAAVLCPDTQFSDPHKRFIKARLDTLAANLGKHEISSWLLPLSEYRGQHMSTTGRISCPHHGTVE